MGGAEAVQRIRAMEGGGGVKIAAITASAFTSERDEVMAAGMEDFIRKPFRPGEIFECLVRHLHVRLCRPESAPVVAAEGKISGEALRALPDGIRAELAQAVVSLDPERVGAAIVNVAEVDASLAAGLKRLHDRFAYTTLWELAGDGLSSSANAQPGTPRQDPANG